MARSFQELREKMDPERRERNRVTTNEIVNLYDLRNALDHTQQELAERLGLRQADISKFEGRYNYLVATLRRYVEAMGARLVIKAVFPADSTTGEREFDLSRVGEEE